MRAAKVDKLFFPAKIYFRFGGYPLASASVATLGHVRGRGPLDTSSAEQDEVDSGRDGADVVGGTEPRPEDSRKQQNVMENFAIGKNVYICRLNFSWL